MIYGANGYTGRLIAQEAVARGMRPTLAGRNSRQIKALAEELDCEFRVFPLSKPPRVAEEIVGTAILLNCAGPFSATAVPMMEACLGSGTHYLDITGEIDVIEAAAAMHDRAALAATRLIPAVGFDVVPSDCLAAMLHQQLPTASRLQLGFTGSLRISPGTACTALEVFGRGGRERRDGRIVRTPIAAKSLEIPFREGRGSAVLVPWGDVASAYYTTGIGNIETYMAMPAQQIEQLRRAGPLLSLAGRWPIRPLLSRMIRRRMPGPSLEDRQTLRGSLWARMSDDAGRAVEATLETPEPYQTTVLTALACVERLLVDRSVRAGFSTPAQTFGAEFILAIPGTEYRLA